MTVAKKQKLFSSPENFYAFEDSKPISSKAIKSYLLNVGTDVKKLLTVIREQYLKDQGTIKIF